MRLLVLFDPNTQYGRENEEQVPLPAKALSRPRR